MSGTSLNGTDYTFLNGTATIAAGQTFVDVPLNVIDDTLIESNETAILTLSTSSNYTVGASNTATVTIADNDQNTVTVSAIDASAAEVISGQTANPGTYRITRIGSTSSAVTVPYTMSGTSLNGTDYTFLNGTATIAAGQTFVDVPLNVIDDTLIESNETAILTLSTSSNYTVGATNTATVTIADNDQNTVTVSALDASAAEVVSGQTPNPGMYRFSRTGSTISALTVPYTMSGTGSNGTDYTSLNGTATIAAGQTFVDVPLNVIDDTLIESNETAILTLSTSSNYTVGASNTATVTIADNDLADWFDLNIQDLGLRSTARVAASDSVINRNEMISILQNAEDGSVIDSTELTNLRNLLSSNTRPFSIPQYVQNLTNKVVNSEIANQTYLGNPLGNLSANSSATQMENLIKKWFLGLDRPSTPYTYQYASGSLFQNGVSYQDINQGGVGDCYYLASLAATAFRSPSTIQNMFVDNGDNTYTVRFYKNGVADYVTVDRYLPTTAWGSLAYAKTVNSELWVALAEKAYAQVNQSAWIQQDGTNSYFGIDGGLGYYAMRHVTGRNTSQVYQPSGIVDTNAIKTAFNAGKMITIGSKEFGVASNLVSQHEYVLVGYNSSTQKFTLYNPHGVNSTSNLAHVDLTASEISQNFDYWAYTTENGLPQYGSSVTLRPELFS
jgi:acetoacetate decarboxylase